MMDELDDVPMRLAICAASGKFDDQVRRWLQAAFVRYLKLDGTVPLERLLRLSPTSKKMRLARRNVCLIEAANQIQLQPQESPWDGAVRLAAELSVFISRGAWDSWKSLSSPPDGTSRLRTALFHFAHANNGATLSAKQIDRIVRHVFVSQCQRDTPIL